MPWRRILELTAAGYILLPITMVFLFRPGTLLQIILIVSAFGATSAIVLNFGDPFGMSCALVPGLLATGMLALDYISRRLQKGELAAAQCAFPMVAFTLCSLAGAILLPRLFAGQFLVWPQNAAVRFNVAVPLAPNSGNITQSLYLAANTIFLAFAALFVSRPGTRYVMFLRAYFIGGYVAVGLALWQFANKLTGIYFPADLIYSNPRWAMATDQISGNVSRINGSFTEPSGLAQYLSGIVFACLPLVLTGYRGFPIRPLLLLSLLVMLISTSTTGLVMAGIAVPVFLLRSRQHKRQALALGLVGTAAAALVLGMIAYLTVPSIASHIEQAADEVLGDQLINKSQTDSALDRSTKDLDSIALLLPSIGLGAGWGSVRSSSLIPGVLGASGLPGFALLLWFGTRTRRLVSRARRAAPTGDSRATLDALAGSIFGTLVASLLSAPTIDEMDFFLRLALLIGCAVRIRLDAAERQTASRPAQVSSPAMAVPRAG